MTENNEVYKARLHWVIFFWPFVFLCLCVFLGFQFEQFYLPALMFAGVALIWILISWLTYYFSSLTIKKNQVILRTGVIMQQTLDIPLSKIESIDIRQSLLGSIFRYGSLVITGTGGTRQIVNYLSNPLTCRRYIEQSLHG